MWALGAVAQFQYDVDVLGFCRVVGRFVQISDLPVAQGGCNLSLTMWTLGTDNEKTLN